MRTLVDLVIVVAACWGIVATCVALWQGEGLLLGLVICAVLAFADGRVPKNPA